MPSIPSLLDTLKKDFPNLTFAPGAVFKWSPDNRIIQYSNLTDTTSLLHEVAHAALDHTSYMYDIELLKMEREAWDFTLATLSKKYNLAVCQDEAENMLDSYRDWLHSRSLCPRCQATGVQTNKNSYSCLSCRNNWRVNEARTCALRRYRK